MIIYPMTFLEVSNSWYLWDYSKIARDKAKLVGFKTYALISDHDASVRMIAGTILAT